MRPRNSRSESGQRSFLSLWCYANPRGKDSKELCDVLVVCDPHLIIISVKDIRLKSESDGDVQRWLRRAVDASVDQLHGAERWLQSAEAVKRRDGTPGLPLPARSDRRIHRIAVACGSQGAVLTSSGDFGKGFVHVLTEEGFFNVLGELDTIHDFAEYLRAKEAWIAGGRSVVLEGSELNLVGLYVSNGRTFPDNVSHIVVPDGLWQTMLDRPEFQKRKTLDRESYAWDALIDQLSDPHAKPIEGSSVELSEVERALRVMVCENRFGRRVLGQALREFLEKAVAGQLRSRVLVGPSGVIYVLVRFHKNDDPNYRRAELGNRCFLARHMVGTGDTIVGVGIGEYVPGHGSTSDLIYMHLPAWSAEDDEHAVRMKAALGFFDGASLQKSHEDEFPTA